MKVACGTDDACKTQCARDDYREEVLKFIKISRFSGFDQFPTDALMLVRAMLTVSMDVRTARIQFALVKNQIKESQNILSVDY